MTYFASTQTTETTCPQCNQAILTALDEGLAAKANAAPLLDQAAEIAVLLQGRLTYTLTRNRHLVHRTAERITSGMPHGTIHAAHQCVGRIQLTIDDMIGNQ